MANVKDRGKDTKVIPDKKSADESERFLNIGSKVPLKNGKTVTVKDIPFSAWLSGFSEVIPLLVSLADQNISEEQLLAKVAMNKTFQQALFTLMSSATEMSPEEVAALGLEDALRVLSVLKKVTDFVEIKKLFSEVGLQMTTLSTAKKKA